MAKQYRIRVIMPLGRATAYVADMRDGIPVFTPEAALALLFDVPDQARHTAGFVPREYEPYIQEA